MYLARASRRGFDLAKLPEAALLPLRRDGLDPVAELGAIRQDEPVSRLRIPFGVSAWLVTGHPEAKAVLGSGAAFSNDFGNLVGSAPGATAEQNPGGLGFADPPHHTRLRKLLQPEFTMRRLKRLTPGIAGIIGRQLDEMDAAGQEGRAVDLVEHFALPIPSLVICELLGVDYERRDDFQRLSMQRFDLFGGAVASLGAISESLDFLLGVVREQRD
ncbi:MAG: cytochrome P450, partial [Thermocrispum sp.]